MSTRIIPIALFLVACGGAEFTTGSSDGTEVDGTLPHGDAGPVRDQDSGAAGAHTGTGGAPANTGGAPAGAGGQLPDEDSGSHTGAGGGPGGAGGAIGSAGSHAGGSGGSQVDQDAGAGGSGIGTGGAPGTGGAGSGGGPTFCGFPCPSDCSGSLGFCCIVKGGVSAGCGCATTFGPICG